MQIDVYSHNFRLSGYLPRDREVIREYLRPYIQMEYERQRNGRFIQVPKRAYASALKDRTEYRFHVNQLDDFLAFLKHKHYVPEQYVITEHPIEMRHFETVDHDVKQMYDPLEKQVPLIDYVLEPGSNKMIKLQTGGGKSLSNVSLVRVPGGWRKIGLIRVGDEVIARDGSATKVVGVYPQGKLQLYRVRFSDGREVEASADHLWQSTNILGTGVFSTAELERLLVEATGPVYIPLAEPEELPSQRLLVDPYWMGMSRTVGALDMRQIPDVYLNGSIAQRWALLQGLLDAEAMIDAAGAVSYPTEVPRLAEAIQYLVRSLGGTASIDEHGVRIAHPDPVQMFRLQGKKLLVMGEVSRAKVSQLEVVAIEPVRKGLATCIAVEHPEKLFVVQDFIVTHNTYIALRCAWLMGARTILTFKGMYVDRWVEGLEETFHLSKDDLVQVRGSAGLAAALEEGIAGELSAKFLIVTNRTMLDFIKAHERNNGHSPLYPVGPDKFHRALRAGFHVMDEVHQEFHLNFKQMTYMHVPKLLALSATMDSSDPFTDKMYQIPFPIHARNDGGKYNVYISVTALFYRFAKPKIIKWKGARRNYSHNAFEQSVMSKADVLANYFKMINYITTHAFLKRRSPGQRMLIFCASVEMCTALVQYLRKLHPDITVSRYTQEDDYDVLKNSDISVSTVLSAGTAVDIPGLRITLMTTAINSRQSNEQALGRLREMKGEWAGITPEFYYLACMDIDKHMEYSESKETYFEGKVTNHRKMNIPFAI